MAYQIYSLRLAMDNINHLAFLSLYATIRRNTTVFQHFILN